MDRRYYEEELRYLREAGRAFAEAHPEEASHLNIDSVTDRDPYVERLFEGFAFLTGRIHERLDDELPEYTEGLLQLLYPHLLKPVPALSIVQLTPKPGLVQETTTLDRGIEVRSKPVGPEDTRCRFQTAAPVHLHPLRLTDTELSWTPRETSSARFRFALERGVNLDDLDLENRPLRLYFHADAPVASAMHLFCTRHVRGISLDAVDGPGGLDLRGDQWVAPGGLDRSEGLLPYGQRSFQGFRLLQEYLSFRRKFWFVDLHGLHRLDAGDADAFDVTLHFDRAYPEDKRFKTDNVRLHCAPIINLFEMDAEPIRAEGLVPEYRVSPSARHKRSITTYDVLHVEGIEDRTGVRHDYTPYYTFRHTTSPIDARPGGDAQGRHFTTSRRIGPTGMPAVYLSLGGSELESLADVPSETLSVEVRCTNGSLPREHLQEGMIDELAPNVPQIVNVTNLTRPTLIREIPDREDFYWQLVSHLSFSFLSIAERESLVGVLDLYDWTGTDANRRRLTGIRDVDWSAKEIMVRGAVLRGVEVSLDIQQGYFADEGDLCLFGDVLSRFFSLYATMNSFVHLRITLSPSGRTYHWRPDRGTQPVL
jgi:type VI secretion system protein ImpG